MKWQVGKEEGEHCEEADMNGNTYRCTQVSKLPSLTICARATAAGKTCSEVPIPISELGHRLARKLKSKGITLEPPSITIVTNKTEIRVFSQQEKDQRRKERQKRNSKLVAKESKRRDKTAHSRNKTTVSKKGHFTKNRPHKKRHAKKGEDKQGQRAHLGDECIQFHPCDDDYDE